MKTGYLLDGSGEGGRLDLISHFLLDQALAGVTRVFSPSPSPSSSTPFLLEAVWAARAEALRAKPAGMNEGQ